MGLLFVVLAVLLATIILRVVEIAQGRPPLPPPKPEHGPYVIGAFVLIVVIPYIVGSRAARLLWRSRTRFYRKYQHQ